LDRMLFIRGSDSRSSEIPTPVIASKCAW